jgi:LemA protein
MPKGTGLEEKEGKVSAFTRVIVVLGVIILLGYFLVAGPYNRFVSLDQQAQTQWAQVETVMQRRMDLIPNLVETTKGYVKHEQKVFGQIAEAQNAWAKAPAGSPQRVTAATQVEAAMGRFLVLVQAYPQLQANQDFRALMDELEGTENRIAVERHRYNDVVKEYNTAIASFPGMLYARMFGFAPKPYFEATAGAEKAPQVKF